MDESGAAVESESGVEPKRVVRVVLRPQLGGGEPRPRRCRTATARPAKRAAQLEGLELRGQRVQRLAFARTLEEQGRRDRGDQETEESVASVDEDEDDEDFKPSGESEDESDDSLVALARKRARSGRPVAAAPRINGSGRVDPAPWGSSWKSKQSRNPFTSDFYVKRKAAQNVSYREPSEDGEENDDGDDGDEDYGRAAPWSRAPKPAAVREKAPQPSTSAGATSGWQASRKVRYVRHRERRGRRG